MTKRRLKKKYKLLLAFMLSILCLLGMIYSSFNIINWKKSIDNNSNIKKEIEKNIVIDEKKNVYNIDFTELKKQNNDTIAYLEVKDTNINYIVVQGNDNEYYLKHNYNKEKNIAGWIFADYHNKFDGSDKNIVIYGHNTKDGSMFGTLINVLDKKWQENKDNHQILLITENNVLNYQVFSTYSIKPEDYYINTFFSSDNEFKEYIKVIKSRSIYNYDIEVFENDQVLTLSSCIGDGRKRVVLHAKLVN